MDNTLALTISGVLAYLITGTLQTPHLNVPSTVDIPVNSSLNLLCWGQYPLEWIYPQLKENVSLPIITSDREVSRYISELTIEYLQLQDRGEYICYYADSSYKASVNTASAKVFVNDLVNLMVPQKTVYLSWCPDHVLVVPCMPTNSMVNIALWAKGQESDIKVNIGDIETFDPFKGFSILINFTVTSIECIGQLNNVTSEPLKFTIHHSEPDFIPHLMVTSEPDRYALINGTITLTCSINVPSFSYRPQWHNIKNETEQRATTDVVVKNGNLSNILSIYNVQESDENCYSCEIHTSCNKVSEEICISVFETKPPLSFNISTHIDKPLVLEVGEKLVLVAYINIFPLDSSDEVDFYWYKDENRLEANNHTDMSLNLPKNSILKVLDLKLSDAGIYTFSGNSSMISKNISVTVKVEGKPRAIITGISNDNFYMAGTRRVFFCDVEGNPLPNATWYWKPCTRYMECDTNWTVVESNLDIYNFDRVMQAVITNIRRIHRLEVKAYQTGYYRCVSDNEHGSDEVTLFFLVSDVKDGFQATVSSEVPIELDNITIECEANMFLYNNIRWEWFPLSGKNSIDMSYISEDNSEYKNISIIYSNTTYSHRLVINFNPINIKNSGTYICYAQPIDNSSDTINSSVSFVVRGILKPVMVLTNLNGSVARVNQNSAYELFCYGRGTPEPVVVWYHNKQALNDSMTTGIKFTSNNQNLVINRVINTDEGLYQCNASNKGGSIVRNITLQVISDQLKKEEGFSLSTKNIIIIISSVLAGVLLFLVTSILGAKFYRKRKSHRGKPFIFNNKFSQGQLELLNPDLSLDEQAELLPYDHCWEFPKERLKIGKTLGQGVFGRVVKAEAIGVLPGEPSTTVAVKLLKEQADVNQQKALMTELKILAHLGHHVNIVNLLGAVTKSLNKGELMVIVEYCHFGNLRHYLLYHREQFVNQIDPTTGQIDESFLPTLTDKNDSEPVAVGVGDYRNRTTSDSELLKETSTSNSEMIIPSNYYINHNEDVKNNQITTCDLISYSFQCARGMEYLASKKLLHRDLAARNVLLAEGNVVKICDFGLAKDLYEYGSYVKKGDGPLPIKWMAVESIRDKIFTTKSDVWSFGILLWEIFTLGRNPYPGIDLNEEFFKRLNNGYRMEKPEYSPDPIYKIMIECWDAEPKNRPGFNELVDKVGTYLEDSTRQHYVNLNSAYSDLNQVRLNGSTSRSNSTIGHDYINVDKNEILNSERSSVSETVDECTDNSNTLESTEDTKMTQLPVETIPMVHVDSSDS